MQDCPNVRARARSRVRRVLHAGALLVFCFAVCDIPPLVLSWTLVRPLGLFLFIAVLTSYAEQRGQRRGHRAARADQEPLLMAVGVECFRQGRSAAAEKLMQLETQARLLADLQTAAMAGSPGTNSDPGSSSGSGGLPN